MLLMEGSAAYAQPPIGYIGLFTDESHDVWCATGVGFYPVEMWIWCLPSERGMICAEFQVCYPTNVIRSTMTWNEPHIELAIGDLLNGLSVCLQNCKTTWFWIAHQLLYVTDQTQSYASICPHPDVGVYQFANCEPGYPTEQCIKYTNLYLNYEQPDPECMGTATRDASWGAIKSMIKE